MQLYCQIQQGSESWEHYHKEERNGSFKEGERYELIHGEAFAMAGPNTKHQTVSWEISVQLGAYLRGKSCRAFSAPGTLSYCWQGNIHRGRQKEPWVKPYHTPQRKSSVFEKKSRAAAFATMPRPGQVYHPLYPQTPLTHLHCAHLCY